MAGAGGGQPRGDRPNHPIGERRQPMVEEETGGGIRGSLANPNNFLLTINHEED